MTSPRQPANRNGMDSRHRSLNLPVDQAGVDEQRLVLEDGTVTLRPEDVGLSSTPAEGAACRLDGSGC